MTNVSAQAQIAQALAAPFPAHDVEWRLQTAGQKNDGSPWAKVLCYVTARAIMERLDLVFGPFGWQDQYAPGPAGGVVCKLSIFDGERWVTKEDGADNTDIEATKGGLSGALKRAAVKWGIGRYLYRLEEGWAIITPEGAYSGKTKEGTWFKWNPPALPAWAIADGDVVAHVKTQTASAPTQRASNPQPAAAIAPNRKESPIATGPVESVKVVSGPAPVTSSSSWRSFPVPPFIKKYAGRTLGDMEAKDIAWWSQNYEPRPYKGSISPRDVNFKAQLVAAHIEMTGEGVQHAPAEIAQRGASDEQLANVEQGPSEDVPF